jgi:hypothetical protein
MQFEIYHGSGGQLYRCLIGDGGPSWRSPPGLRLRARRAPRRSRRAAARRLGRRDRRTPMTSGVDPLQRPGSRSEAERQLAAAVERHREIVASMQELGRPETAQHIAVKAVGRAVHSVSLALGPAAECGVPLERPSS